MKSIGETSDRAPLISGRIESVDWIAEVPTQDGCVKMVNCSKRMRSIWQTHPPGPPRLLVDTSRATQREFSGLLQRFRSKTFPDCGKAV